MKSFFSWGHFSFSCEPQWEELNPVKHRGGIWSGHMNPFTQTHTVITRSQSAPDVFACAIIPAKTLAQMYLFCVCACVCIRSCWSCKCLPFELLADLLAPSFSCLAFPSVLTFLAKSAIVSPCVFQLIVSVFLQLSFPLISIIFSRSLYILKWLHLMFFYSSFLFGWVAH